MGEEFSLKNSSKTEFLSKKDLFELQSYLGCISISLIIIANQLRMAQISHSEISIRFFEELDKRNIFKSKLFRVANLSIDALAYIESSKKMSTSVRSIEDKFSKLFEIEGKISLKEILKILYVQYIFGKYEI